jgi:hypothetical protein
MKEIFKKPAQLTLALLISWIVTYGIVFAQPLCCGTTIDRCLPAIKRTQTAPPLSIKCRAPLSQRRNPQLYAIGSPAILQPDFDDDVTCCKKESCDGINQTTYFNSSPAQNSILPVTRVGLVGAKNGFQNALNLKSQSRPLRLTSIYILTKSIVC